MSSATTVTAPDSFAARSSAVDAIIVVWLNGWGSHEEVMTIMAGVVMTWLGQSWQCDQGLRGHDGGGHMARMVMAGELSHEGVVMVMAGVALTVRD